MKQGFHQLNGQRFFVRTWGDPSKPPLLLLHGFPEYSGAWEELAPCLTERFFCVAPDQRGFGQSWSPVGDEHYAAAQLVGDMNALIDLLGGQATVLGHDWGAAVAYGLSFSPKTKVDRLIIANGVHPVPFQRSLTPGSAQARASHYFHYLRKPGAAVDLAADGFAKLQALFARNMDMSWLGGARLEAYKNAWGTADQLDRMLAWYRKSQIKVPKPEETSWTLPEFPVERLRVHCPHLLIWGENDTALLPEATEGLEDYARDLTRVNVSGADHWLLHQKPDEVAQIILEWSGR
ncbi:MAG: alpha/beta fold hydrolase [Rhodobacteraceae bacterium]|nr:alpha/beta fold hydrolase [Paracoccaceae bacterium]